MDYAIEDLNVQYNSTTPQPNALIAENSLGTSTDMPDKIFGVDHPTSGYLSCVCEEAWSTQNASAPVSITSAPYVIEPVYMAGKVAMSRVEDAHLQGELVNCTAGIFIGDSERSEKQDQTRSPERIEAQDMCTPHHTRLEFVCLCRQNCF
jgi:hypothetical protein